jgi:hypothetical protein
MRANVPTDNDENVLRPVVDDEAPIDKVTEEQKELAKIGNSPNLKILTDYLEKRIEIYKNGLFGEDLTGKSTAIVGQRFLAAQSVVAEFQSLIKQVEDNTHLVNEAAKASEPTAVRPK